MIGLELFVALIVAHAVCDYPLQGDFLARAKSRLSPIPGVPWQQAMAAHVVMHGGAVWFLTGSLWLGLAEMAAHALIDDAKCRGRIGFNADQAAHVVCKAAWVALAVPGGFPA